MEREAEALLQHFAASPRRGFDRELSLPGPKPSSFGIIEGSLSEGKVLRAGLQQPLEEGAVLGGSGLCFVNGIWGEKKKNCCCSGIDQEKPFGNSWI